MVNSVDPEETARYMSYQGLHRLQRYMYWYAGMTVNWKDVLTLFVKQLVFINLSIKPCELFQLENLVNLSIYRNFYKT